LSAWVEVHQGTAERVAADWKVQIDLLYLDGDQSRAGARAAYDAWAPFLKQGGIIAIHNTDPNNQISGHDGNWHLVETAISAPRYADVYRVGGTTFARKILPDRANMYPV